MSWYIPTVIQLNMRLIMRFNVTYDKLELVVDAQYIDDSFEHAFGTQHQGYYEVNALFYNGTMIPLALVSEETLKILEEKINNAT